MRIDSFYLLLMDIEDLSLQRTPEKRHTEWPYLKEFMFKGYVSRPFFIQIMEMCVTSVGVSFY